MPKLSDLRDQLRSGQLEQEIQEYTRQYKVAAGGADAMILFGKHKHLTLAQIQARDPAYLNWILQEDFPSELKDIVRFIQGANKRAADMKAMAEAAEALGEVAADAGKKAAKFMEAVGEGVVKTVDSVREELSKLSPEELKKLLDEASSTPATVTKLKTRHRNEDIIGMARRAPRFGGSKGFKPKAKHR